MRREEVRNFLVKRNQENSDLVHNELETVSRFLPFDLLLCKTFLPPLVAILARNPCRLLPFIFVGVLRCFFIGKIVTHLTGVSTTFAHE
jgi:hypothetical protein